MVTYPVNWYENRLGDVCKYVNGTALEEYFSNYGNRRVISLGNYSEEGKYIDDGNRINLNQKTQSFLLFKDDLSMVLNDKGNGRLVGKVLFIDENDKYIFNQRSLRIVPEKNKVAPLFLYHLINSGIFRDRLKPHIQGNTQVYINPPAVMSIPIYLPSLQEQQTIASVLSDFHEHIDNLSELIEKKKAIRDGALEDLVSGRTRLDGFNGEWVEMTLEDICVPNGLVRGPFGGSLKKEMFVSKGNKVYEQRNAIYKSVRIGDYYISNGKYNELSRFAVKADDFIVSCSGTIGKIFKIPKQYKRGIINQALLKISIDQTKCNLNYFYKYFEWDKFQDSIIDNTQGGAMKNLVGMDIFRKTVILMPRDITEQKAIAQIISAMDEEIESLKIEKEKMIQIKEGAMDDLLTGRVRLNV